jgi:uncharacterized protein YndB with AHSA1/START domain
MKEVQTMEKKALQVKTQLKIAKPARLVFEAIVNPEEMSHYFISSGTRRMQSGSSVQWKFEKGGAVDVRVEHAEPDRPVSFFWSASGIEKTLVAIELVPVDDGGTLDKISESEWPPDEKGIARCVKQTQGWMHFLCCMKAYLQYGINLRA